MSLNEQRSFPKENDSDAGGLYLVPTPIGNLQDMTFRAVQILKEADVIAAEDTRHTKKLCHAFDIQTPLLSYHEHNKREREQTLVDRVLQGEKVALVSDAGTPAISDPGADLVKRLTEEGLRVIALPGANAAITALVVSALSTESFTFAGFLSRHKKERQKQLDMWRTTPSTLIFYEAPHRLKDMLKAASEIFGNRRAVLCRELTKQYETILRGTILDLHEKVEASAVKGECVVLIEGASEEERQEAEGSPWWEELSLRAHVNAYIDEGVSSKQAIKQAAQDRELPKRDVYQAYHVDGDE